MHERAFQVAASQLQHLSFRAQRNHNCCSHAPARNYKFDSNSGLLNRHFDYLHSLGLHSHHIAYAFASSRHGHCVCSCYWYHHCRRSSSGLHGDYHDHRSGTSSPPQHRHIVSSGSAYQYGHCSSSPSPDHHRDSDLSTSSVPDQYRLHSEKHYHCAKAGFDRHLPLPGSSFHHRHSATNCYCFALPVRDRDPHDHDLNRNPHGSQISSCGTNSCVHVSSRQCYGQVNLRNLRW
jgi:hypothetical protein